MSGDRDKKLAWQCVIPCGKCGRFIAGLVLVECTGEAVGVLKVGVHCAQCKEDTIRDIQLKGPKQK